MIAVVVNVALRCKGRSLGKRRQTVAGMKVTEGEMGLVSLGKTRTKNGHWERWWCKAVLDEGLEMISEYVKER